MKDFILEIPNTMPTVVITITTTLDEAADNVILNFQFFIIRNLGE